MTLLSTFNLYYYNAMTASTNKTNLFKTAFRELMKGVNTNIPGHIVAFDKDTQMAQVQIGVKQVLKDGTQVEPATLIQVYVGQQGGKYICETEVNVGDEGLIIFLQRCIDGWIDTGGVANNPILRLHDQSDAFFLPNFKSQPNKIKSFENNGVRLRNEDGTKYVWLKNNGDVEISANNFNVTSTTFTHNNINVGATHTHIGSPTAATGPISPTGTPV